MCQNAFLSETPLQSVQRAWTLLLQCQQKMAMQAGVSTSKVLILVGAGLTGSVILRSGNLSDLIFQLQEILKGVNETDVSPDKYNTAVLAAQIRQLAQEIKELTLSNPVTIVNGKSDTSGSYASYIMPAAALGAMGYCYMWWKGWSISDVMFVTRHNMANAVTSVSKQLEYVTEALASTKRHLSKKLENLDWKVEDQKEISKQIADDVSEVKSSLSEIGFDVETIHQMVSEVEGKMGLLESKQDWTNNGLWYLCQVAESVKDESNSRPIQNFSAKLGGRPTATQIEGSLKGLQFLVDTNDAHGKSTESLKMHDLDSKPAKVVSKMKTRVHRAYAVGISSGQCIMDCY